MTDATLPDPTDDLAAASHDLPPRIWRRVLREPGAVTGLAFVGALVLIAVLAPLVVSHDATAQDLRHTFADPFTRGHLLGTDELGRDTLSRLIFAVRPALLSAFGTVAVAITLGMPPGLLAGYVGGRVDFAVMRVADALQSFPPLIFAIALVASLGPGLRNTILVVGVLFVPGFLRLTRAAVLDMLDEAYIEASRAIGTPPLRIVWSRVLPNIAPPLLVQTALSAGFALLAEAGLSFLGLGVQPPDPSWGAMVARGYGSMSRQPWLIVFPGVMIGCTVLACNGIGEGVRRAMGRGSGGR